MDSRIRDWLQNTADREPPDEDESFGFPDFLQPQRYAKEDDTARRSHRKRKRASSEPVASPRRHRHTARGRGRSRSGSGDSQRRADGSASSRDSHRSGRSRSSSSVQKQPPTKSYERRARHKTRPDRYELKPKKDNKESERRKEKQSKKKRRKTHPAGDGERTAGLVQGFQLKNGPKNNRLTLRPNAAGIFKRGRSSAQVAAGGTGLPDLVFNEMKFLQRPKEHQDEMTADDAGKQPAKKTRKQMQEEEISAYFSRKAPVEKQAQEKSGAPPAAGHNTKDEGSRGGSPAQHQEVEGTVEKSFLGFGGRGPVQGSAGHKASDSYYTWSESLPAKPSPRRASLDHLEPRQATIPQRSHQRRDSRRSGIDHQRPSPGPAADGGEWIQTRRVLGPTLVETYKLAPREKPSPAQSSSQALPSQPHLARDGVNSRHRGGQQSGSYHTSDILNLQEAVATNAEYLSIPAREGRLSNMINKENENPSTSTPTSKLLRQAYQSVINHRDLAAHDSLGMTTNAGINDPRHNVHFDQEPSIDTAFADSHRVQEFDTRTPALGRPHPPPWTLPARGFNRTIGHEQLQATLSHAVLPALDNSMSNMPQRPPDFHARRNSGATQQVPDRSRMPLQDTRRLYTNGQQTEALVRRLMSQDEPQLYGPGRDRTPRELGRQQQGLSEPTIGDVDQEMQFVTSISVDQRSMPLSELVRSPHDDFGGGRNVSDAHEVTQEMAGFWRPNVLY